MNQELVAEVKELVEGELEEDETLLGAICGSLRVEAVTGADWLLLWKKRKARRAFEAESGVRLSTTFALALTPRRMLMLKAGGLGLPHPKLLLGAMPLTQVSDIVLGERVVKMQAAAIVLAKGATLPVLLQTRDDPEEFAQTFARVARAG